MPDFDGTGPRRFGRRRRRSCQKQGSSPGQRSVSSFKNTASIVTAVSSFIAADLNREDSIIKGIGQSFKKALINHKKRLELLRAKQTKRLQPGLKVTILDESVEQEKSRE